MEEWQKISRRLAADNAIFGTSAKKERDERRSFNRSEQNEIWDRQKGRCVGKHCRHSLLRRSAVHYDHIKPWELGGKTIPSNGQALCPTCHSIKTNKDRLKKQAKARTSKKGTRSSSSGFGFDVGGSVSGFKIPKQPRFI